MEPRRAGRTEQTKRRGQARRWSAAASRQLVGAGPARGRTVDIGGAAVRFASHSRATATKRAALICDNTRQIKRLGKASSQHWPKRSQCGKSTRKHVVAGKLRTDTAAVFGRPNPAQHCPIDE
uniref:Uncharacterized protein n=1 Tax=Plectus sambesii TaxID=2011161 RepID=A0A914W0C3_9BILA